MDQKKRNSIPTVDTNEDKNNVDPLMEKYTLFKKKRDKPVSEKDFVSEILENLALRDKEMNDIKCGVIVERHDSSESKTSTVVSKSDSENRQSLNEEPESKLTEESDKLNEELGNKLQEISEETEDQT